MKINTLFLFFYLGLNLSLWAQQGSVKGVITDAENGETLVGVTIIISRANDTTKRMIDGTSTDLDGNYIISLDEGQYIFSLSYVSYESAEKTVAITKGKTITYNIQLSGASVQLQAVEVIARVSRESENLLLMDQKKANGIEEKIGSRELSRKGASNVAAGLKKIAGISMMGSKQLFVRGLGDRYNATQLNGLPLISPDPCKKIIKLDIFPSDIIEYLKVQKAYSVQNYADYTGALININTLDYPEEAFLSFSLGSTYNSNSTGISFSRINANGFRYMGFDVAKRQALTPRKYWVAKRRTQIIEADFNYASYGYTNQSAPPALDFALTGGKLFRINEKRKVGILLNVSHNNEYVYKPDIIQKQVNRQNIPDGDFTASEYSYNSFFTTFLSLSYLHNELHKIKYQIIYLNNGEDAYKEKIGTRPDWQNGEKTATIRNAQYIHYKLLNQQLSGSHQVAEKLKLNWAAAFSTASYDVPDRREVVYINPTSNDKDSWVYMTLNNGNDSKRVIVEQGNNEIDFSLHSKYKLGDEGRKGSISVGFDMKRNQLEYRSYYYGYVFETQAGNQTLAVDINNPDAYFGPEYLEKIRNNSSDDMGYNGLSNIWAAFADIIFRPQEKISLNAGLRMESSIMSLIPNMNVKDGDEKEISYSNLDLFPAVNIKYRLNENMNIRLAASRTVTRPSFYEKSPAFIIPESGNRQIIGNPYTKENRATDGSYLVNSYSNNLEMKWEYFPRLGEIISLGAYSKMIEEPIERVSKLKGGTDVTYTYQNFQDKGFASGLELLIKKKFNHIFTGFNAAYIYTLVEIPDQYNELHNERQLQGASPYLLNADLGYEMLYGSGKQNKSYISLVYNVYGKRIYSVGISGEGNQYQMPFHSLDFILKNSIGEKFQIDLSIKNILNAKYTIKQDVYENADASNEVTNSVVINQYTKGINIGIRLKYSL